MKKGKKYTHPSYSGVFDCVHIDKDTAWMRPEKGANGFLVAINAAWKEVQEPVHRFVNLYWNQNTRSFSIGMTHVNKGDAEYLMMEKEGCFLVDTLEYEVGKYAEANPPSKRK